MLYAVVVLPALFLEFARRHRVVGCLICVVAVVLGWWAFAEAVSLARKGARVPPCNAHLHNIGLGLRYHAEDHGGALPDTLSDLRGVVEGEGIFVCPVARKRGVPGWQDSYECAGAGLRLAEIKNPAAVPLAFDRAGNHGDKTRNVAFADMSVRGMSETEFRQVLVEAIRRGAYAPDTGERLKRDEPWLDAEGRGVP